MRMIDVEAFSKEMKKRYCTNCDSYNGVRCRACWVDDMISDVEDFPTVDAEPVRHEHWVVFKDENGIFRNKCSGCGAPMRKGYKQTNFCPQCGANMNGSFSTFTTRR